MFELTARHRHPTSRPPAVRLTWLWALYLLAAVLVLPISAPAAEVEDASSVEARLSADVSYLASEELEGRGVGTEGLERAAEHIAAEFANLGLHVEVYDGPFQKFTVSTGAELGDGNEISLAGPEGNARALELGEDYTPLALSGSAEVDLPLVFVGYGITAKELDYDDYEGIDVQGKAVIILRHQPQQGNPHSPFGAETSRHAPFVRKVSNAYEHGAAAVIFVTGQHEINKQVERRLTRWQTAIAQLKEEDERFRQIERPSIEQIEEHRETVDKLLDEIRNLGERLQAEYDPVLSFNAAGQDSDGRDFPVLYIRRGVLDEMLRDALGQDLAALEKAIDNGPTPQSQPLASWSIRGKVDVERQQTEIKNVVAVLEGEGPLADEAIVIGAHYDHLGWGGPGSLAPGVKAIHHGADDNASGTAVLLEIARDLASRPEKLPRTIVFIAFTGEERGLLGSAQYVRDPIVPLEKTIAMLNMDMVGRLEDDKLIVHGTGAAAEFTSLVDRLNEVYAFDITKKPIGFGPSDHASFYAKSIPALHFFTGSHADYHRPSDTADKLNIAGMRRIGEMVRDMAIVIAETPERPTYQATERPRNLGGGDRPYFGSIPDFSQDQPGYAVTGVTKGGPAEKAGLTGGDIIIRFGDSQIGNLEDFDSALRKYKAGDKVPVIVRRGGEELTLEVTLDDPR